MATGDTLPLALDEPRFYQEVLSKQQLQWVADADRVALPETGGTVSFTDYVLADEFSSANGGALKDVEPTAAELRRIPIYEGIDPGEKPKLYKRMRDANIVAFQDAPPKCVNGLFATAKTDGKLRLIIDLRRGNLYFKGCKDLKLLNPAHLAEIIVEGDKVFFGKTDISNFFHMVRVPVWLSQFFGLPRVWSTTVGLDGPPRWVWPVCTSLPMGFLRSVDIAQLLHDAIVEPALPPHCSTIGTTPSLRLKPGVTLHSPYIDDDAAGGVDDPALPDEAIDAIKDSLDGAGLHHKPSKLERAGATSSTEVLGISIHEAGYALAAPGSLARALGSVRFLRRVRRCSSKVLHQVVGLWSWAMLLNRPMLSILDATHVFIQEDGPTRRLPSAVLRELRALDDLAPMLVTNLKRRPATVAMATDASMKAQGVCYTALSDADFDHLAQHARLKGWRTRHDGAIEVPPSEDDRDTATSVEALDARFAPVADFVISARWRTSVSKRWRGPVEHITLLEARAALSGLKWLARQPRHHHSRVPFFIDSQACLGAFAKGRSSSRKLNRLLRRSAAYIFAAHLRVSWLWVPTDFNPADAPSRS
jgi:hypothetical protein